MIMQIKYQFNIHTFSCWIIVKTHITNDEIKASIVYCSIKEIYQPNINYNNNKVKKKSSYYAKHHNKPETSQMNEQNENTGFLIKESNVDKKPPPLCKNRNTEMQFDKENCLKFYNYPILNNAGCGKKDSNNSKHNTRTNKHGYNIDREEVLNIVAGGDGEVKGDEKDVNNSKERSATSDDILNNFPANKCKLNDERDKDKFKEDNVKSAQIQSNYSQQPLAAYVETQTSIAATAHLNERHVVKDLGEQILHGQQINVHNLLDVAGRLCAGPMGALCDMAAFSKLDYSSFSDLKDHTISSNNQDFLAKKYYHPLYAHGVCRWPGCELPLDDMATFVKHLKTEHCLDDRSTAQARVQMQVVSQLEMHLQKERDRLQAMMHHLYLTKHFVMPEETQENVSHIRYKNAIRSVSSTPDLNKSNHNSNDDSDGDASDLQTLLINSSNTGSTRKRICDKSPLALAGGLPYMLERAGLDVQQEIQRNREFYKNADVRPPFTYASLIRQSIIESPDKQLTLNEIYNWFQNTFCYFRRNAATWKNAIRTNLSLHKCFVRYEDDFGSFWMVDDSEFVKRRHLSRGRPRKYEPSSSPNSNSQQFGNTNAATASSDAVDGSSDTIVSTTSPDSSTAGSSSRQRSPSSSKIHYSRSGNSNNNGSENSGGNDDYDICEASRRSPAGCQTHKQYCGSKQRPHLPSSIIGFAIKTNINSVSLGHNHIGSRTSNSHGGVVATGSNPGIGGIGDIGSVGSLDVDNLNIANTSIVTEDTNGYDFHTQSISNDGILHSPTGGKNNNGRYSPNMQNMWSFGSSLSDEVTSAEFSCINNDRYRNLVTGLHLQSLTQRHHFHQHKPASSRIHGKTQQQQNTLRNNISNQQHDVRSLQQSHGYHIYHTNQEEQHQKLLLDQQNQPLGQDIFAVNAILSNTDKYFNHNIECRSDGGESFKNESFNPRQQQQHLTIRHHAHSNRSDLSSSDELTNLYIQHHNGHEIDVKYTPPHKTLYNFETQNLNRIDINLNKRSADDSYSNKTADTAEEDSGIVDCDTEEIRSKRKKSHLSSLDYDNVEIKAETESETELRNIDIPLRTKSY